MSAAHPPSRARQIYWKLRSQTLQWLLRRVPDEPWLFQRVHYWSLEGKFLDQVKDQRVTVGRHTYGVRGEGVRLALATDRMVVGNFCSIALGVNFIFGEHPLQSVSTFPLRTLLLGGGNVDAFSKGQITIGSDVWLGANAMILTGVEIGHGAVVAAGAIVTRNVPPYAVVGGAPARIIKMRFRPDQIERLLSIAWWNWPDDKVVANLDLFYADVDTFIRHFSTTENAVS